MAKLHYSDFVEDIDVDAFEEAIGFAPLSHYRGNDVGHCLFPDNHTHGDTTGKFAIHRDKKVYNCFVCGGGSLLSLAMELYDFDVDEAIHWLRQFALADTRSDSEFKDYLLSMLEDTEHRVATMPYFNERVLDRYTDDRSYFGTRGISDDIINAYNLRYSQTTLKPAPMKRDSDGGLYKIGDDYSGPVAIFPHYWGGRLVGWQHRWMDYPDLENSRDTDADWPRWLAKYTNTTDFPKDSTLFNYDEALKSTKPVVVVESVPTALFLISYGYQAVSYFGGSINDAQLRLLRRFSQGVVLAPDNDDVGTKFVNRAASYLERFIPVFEAEKVDGPKADLGEYAKVENSYDRYLLLTDHLNERVHPVRIDV